MRIGGVIRDKPNALTWRSFNFCFIDFYSCEVVSSSETRKNEASNVDRFTSAMVVALKLKNSRK